MNSEFVSRLLQTSGGACIVGFSMICECSTSEHGRSLSLHSFFVVFTLAQSRFASESSLFIAWMF